MSTDCCAKRPDSFPFLLCIAFILLLVSAVSERAVAQSQPIPESLQKDYALIYGTVWGPGDRPLPGVPVNIRPASSKKTKWQHVSDGRGEFAQRVPVGPGDYIVEADIKVPKGQAKPAVKVHVDNNERQDVSFHLTQQQLPK